MEHTSDQADGLLRQPSSHLSDYSLNSNSTLVTSPSSSTLHRHGHHRADSTHERDASDHGAGVSQQDGHGLGITNLNERKKVSISRKPVVSANPGSADSLLPPMSAYGAGEIELTRSKRKSSQVCPILHRTNLLRQIQIVNHFTRVFLPQRPTSNAE